MSAISIISNAKELTSNEFSALDPTIPDGFAPAVNFTSPIITMPGGGATANLPYDGNVKWPTYSPAGEPEAAAYAGAVATIKFVATKLSTPSYKDPTDWTTVPTPAFNQPPLDYPSNEFQDVPFDHGLLGVKAPNIKIGNRLPMIEFDFSEYDMADLTLLDEDVPDYDIPEGKELDSPTEPKYLGDASFIEEIRKVLVSGRSLKDTAQNAMMADKSGDIHRENFRKEQQIVEKAADSGFFNPTGTATGELLLVRYEEHEQQEKVHREITDEVYKRASAVFSQAVHSGLSLQEKHLAIIVAYAERLTRIQRYNVQMAVLVLTTLVSLFNTKVSAVRIFVDNYKEYVQAVREQNTTISSTSKELRAMVDTKVADVSQYRAQLGTAKQIARGDILEAEAQMLEFDAYSTYIHTLMSNMTIARSNIESYKTAVQAFSQAGEQNLQQIEADMAAIDAWSSESEVVAANSRLQADHAGKRAANANTHAQYVQDVIRVLSAQVQEFEAYSRAQRGYFDAITGKIEAGLQVLNSHQNIAREATQYVGDWNQAEAASKSAANRLALAVAEQSTRQSALSAQNTAAQARIEAGRLAAKANAAAGGAQAAYGITSSSIRVAGSVGTSEGSRLAQSTSYDTSATRSFGKHFTVRNNST